MISWPHSPGGKRLELGWSTEGGVCQLLDSHGLQPPCLVAIGFTIPDGVMTGSSPDDGVPESDLYHWCISL